MKTTLDEYDDSLNDHFSDLYLQAIDDLCKGIIRTPLPPLETLLDDPLRVLRAIRFASRLQFQPDPELLQAAKNERVQVCSALVVCCPFLIEIGRSSH